jgi:hypothetical protein
LKHLEDGSQSEVKLAALPEIILGSYES